MSDNLITIEKEGGPFQVVFQRILRMVPDRDKNDKSLQRLLAFRLKIDGEAALSEYLIHKIRETIKCAYTGSLYNFSHSGSPPHNLSIYNYPPEYREIKIEMKGILDTSIHLL